MSTQSIRINCALMALAASSLAACSGSSGGAALVVATPAAPTPTPAVPPTAIARVELLDHPASGELAVASAMGPTRVRYDAARDIYELQTPGADWAKLVVPVDDQAKETVYFFTFERTTEPQGSMSIGAHYRASGEERRYRYSNLAAWYEGNVGSEWGNSFALGTPTPVGSVPVSGQASYRGFADGIANVPNDGWGATANTPLFGAVQLNFDFGAGTLAGQLDMESACDCVRNFRLPSLAFIDTVFGKGNTTFSGQFSTPASGANSFQGQFTGPQAQELIAAWFAPFVLDGHDYQARGSWVAKRP